jgi:hypothetical protein
MAFGRNIRDIARGSIWIDCEDGSRVIVKSAGNHYVEFMRGRDQLETWYDQHFRKRFLAERSVARLERDRMLRAAVRKQFSMSLANLDHLHAFWCPVSSRLFVRNVKREPSEAYKPSRGRGGAVPASARYIGTYANPCNAEDFLEDLDALITRINAERRSAGAERGPQRGFATATA